MRETSRRSSCAGAMALAATALLCIAPARGADHADPQQRLDSMSAMGKRAAIISARLADPNAEGDVCFNEPRCGRGLRESAPGGQAELSIAVDETGQHIVIGFNDTRGFGLNPISVSGYMYSEDGGKTFVDGGQLPSPGDVAIGATRLPQVFGDPEVKYLGNCVFIYASIVVAPITRPQGLRTVQTMGVHRSTDCGKTWTGPFVIPSASNPNGQFSSSTGNPRDAADKEFLDVDPDTGRVMMSWSNFTPFAPGGVEIRTTYSDDVKTAANPTWSTSVIASAIDVDGQSSVPRFARKSNNAYVAWRRFPFPGTFFGYGNTVGFARSLDNGATWQPAINTSDEFFTMDQVLGNDRVNTSPSLAVDTSDTDYAGNVYLVYADNNSGDGADIVFQRSTDEGRTFSAPVALNAGPGEDRAQWFPWITVDPHEGCIYVFYYDQGIDRTGDLTEVSFIQSRDGGVTWSAPNTLSRRPFRAGWGNDTGQPNLGDYNQAVAQDGELFAAFAVTARPPGGFIDGQPSGNMTVPDVEFRRSPSDIDEPLNSLPLSIDVNGISFVDGNGNGYVDPGESLSLRLPLENYTVNEISRGPARSVLGWLGSPTAGVSVTRASVGYGTIAYGATGVGSREYRLALAPDFVPGTPIELELHVDGRFGGHVEKSVLRHTLLTGTPQATTLLSENFDSAAGGALPAGWTAAHGGGANTVPWVTRTGFCGNETNAAFHQNANDNPAGSPVRWERLFSPVLNVPADSDYVTIEMDVCTDTEDDPNFNVQAYDGFFLRIFDGTPGAFPRSVLVEAYADELTTGAAKHYPKHFPRSSNPAYFEDMSAWAGFSNGPRRVKMRLPGMGGRTVQLRFEYTQDGFGTCLDVGGGPVCGVSVDNLVVKSVRSAAPAP